MHTADQRSPGSRFTGLLREIAFVALCGGILAFAANFLSPRGLSLGRNYFPPSATPAPPPADSPSPEVPAAAPTGGFATASRADVEEMTRGPRFATRKFLLIDARNADTHAAGHIPGSLQFDHFRPEINAGEILSACLDAEKIVIYCHGGSCDDSVFAARMLQEFGVPAERFSIYAAGFHDWQSADLPVHPPKP